jgi:hypothetical protein
MFLRTNEVPEKLRLELASFLAFLENALIFLNGIASH